MDVDPNSILKYIKSEPKYAGEVDAFARSVSKLPDYDYSRFYSSYDIGRSVIYQGDNLTGLVFVDIPDVESYTARGIILSNTCDIDLANERMFSSKIVYAPLVKLRDYEQLLKTSDEHGYTDEQIEAHLGGIRAQKVGQIFYFPIGPNLEDEAIIFFDSLCSARNESIERDNVVRLRTFSLSAYGWYILMERLAMFFTRPSKDNVELRFTPTP